MIFSRHPLEAGYGNPYRTLNTTNIPISPYDRGTEQITFEGFGIEREKEFLLWQIFTLDNSRLPTVLRSSYTNTELAKAAISRYLDSKTIKKQKKEEELDNGSDRSDYP